MYLDYFCVYSVIVIISFHYHIIMSWLCMILRGELFCPPSCMIIHTMHYGCTGHFTWVRPGSSPRSSHPSHSLWVNKRDSKHAYMLCLLISTGFIYTPTMLPHNVILKKRKIFLSMRWQEHIIKSFPMVLSSILPKSGMRGEKMKIHLNDQPDVKPTKVLMAYPIPLPLWKEANLIIRKMLKEGVIKKVDVTTAWCVPDFFCQGTKQWPTFSDQLHGPN